jgi:hypothetical protein
MFSVFSRHVHEVIQVYVSHWFYICLVWSCPLTSLFITGKPLGWYHLWNQAHTDLSPHAGPYSCNALIIGTLPYTFTPLTQWFSKLPVDSCSWVARKFLPRPWITQVTGKVWEELFHPKWCGNKKYFFWKQGIHKLEILKMNKSRSNKYTKVQNYMN